MARAALGPAGGLTVSGRRVATEDMLLPVRRDGTLAVAAGTRRWYPPFPLTILGVSGNVSTAPVGAAVIFDVNRNGTTIFTTQANRPTIADGAFRTAPVEIVPDVIDFTATDYLTLDVDQVGSTTAGADLVVNIRYRRT